MAEHGARHGPLASIQAAIFLCEGAGEISEETLHALRVDSESFPQAARAVDQTCASVSEPPDRWPEGFWPRFLLRLLAGHEDTQPA